MNTQGQQSLDLEVLRKETLSLLIKSSFTVREYSRQRDAYFACKRNANCPQNLANISVPWSPICQIIALKRLLKEHLAVCIVPLEEISDLSAYSDRLARLRQFARETDTMCSEAIQASNFLVSILFHSKHVFPAGCELTEQGLRPRTDEPGPNM